MNLRTPTIVFTVLLSAFGVLCTQIDLLPELTWHDQQRIGQVCFLALIAVLWIASSILHPSRHAPPLAWTALFTSVAVIGAISASIAKLPDWAWVEWSLLIALSTGVIAVASIRQLDPKAFDRAVLIAIAIICSVLALRFLATYTGGMLAGGPLDTKELTQLGFSNRRFLGQFQTLTLPVLGLPVLLALQPRTKAAAFVLLAIWWLIACASATRGTFLAMLVGTATVGFLSGGQGKQFARLHALAFIAGASFFALLFIFLPEWLSVPVQVENRLGNLLGSSGRSDVWLHTIRVAIEHPWLGVGPMHLAYFPAAEVSAANPHNAVLQLAAEWGLPASFLGIACAGIALRRFAIFQRAACTRSPLSVALLCALLGAATQSLVDGVIVMPYTQIFLMVVAGWALGMYWDQVGSDPGRRRISPKFYGIAFAGCIGLLAWKVGTDAPRLVERQDAYVVDHGAHLYPRFWQQGWIGVPEAAVQRP